MITVDLDSLMRLPAQKPITPIMGYDCVPEEDRKILSTIKLDSWNGIVAGGAALRWWGGQTVDDHDIDVWFKNESDLRSAISVLDSVGTNTITTANAKSYRVECASKEYTVQLIHKTSPGLDALFSEFDITLCKIATDGTRWWIGPQFAQDYKTKTLRMTQLRKNSLRRFIKYVNYGYQPTPDLWQALLDCPEVVWDYSTLESFEDYAEF